MRLPLILIISLWVLSCFGQDSEPVKDILQTPTLSVKKATGKITLDGVLDEEDWRIARVASQFIQSFPYDTSLSETKTDVRITHDDRNIYIAAVCYDRLKKPYVIQSLRRDFEYSRNDAFAVFIDPLSDESNGFSFVVSPMGVQQEALVADGGAFGVATEWDNRWFSAVTNLEDRWVVEMSIPLKTLRYKGDITSWRFNFARNDLKRNEESSWSRVPRNINIASLANTGIVTWEKPPKKAGANISLIPYGLVGVSKDYQNNLDPDLKRNIGLDAKIGITSSLNLDVTINPDFSQVEVDRQVINLDRFTIFFPERRLFFLENSDLFARFGFSRIRPFFSRRIGLNNGEVIPIIAGLRLSGKVNQNLRIGLMSIQTEGVPADEEGDPGVRSQNFTVAALQYKVFARSNIGLIFVNRQGFEGYNLADQDYNRVIGADFNIMSKDGKLQGKLFAHQSFSPENPKSTYANASWLQYTHRNFFAMWNHELIGENYNAEVGFVPRKGLFRLEPKFDYFFYPKKGNINNHGPNIYWNFFTNLDFKVTDNLLKFDYDLVFNNQSFFNVNYREVYTFLTFDFDPSGTGSAPLPALTGYNYRTGGFEYRSDFRKPFYFEFFFRGGTYYNGNRLRFVAEVNYRFQPWGTVSIAAERNEIRLPDPYSDGFLTLVGPKIDVTFTKSLFLTTFIQYNSQIDNININARFQWRFAPMSDLFIVYTDNYDPTNPFSVKNRSFVVKLNYWFSI